MNVKNILFNTWKHHLGFIKKQIQYISSITELPGFSKKLLVIGGSQMDLYTGHQSPDKICIQMLGYLQTLDIQDKEKYGKWIIASGKDYREFTISDGSVWVLRQGTEKEKYVHIHPGRYSPVTIRVKSGPLKTVMMVLAFQSVTGKKATNDLETINSIREEFLRESPVKSLNATHGINRVLKLFAEGK